MHQKGDEKVGIPYGFSCQVKGYTDAPVGKRLIKLLLSVSVAR